MLYYCREFQEVESPSSATLWHVCLMSPRFLNVRKCNEQRQRVLGWNLYSMRYLHFNMKWLSNQITQVTSIWAVSLEIQIDSKSNWISYKWGEKEKERTKVVTFPRLISMLMCCTCSGSSQTHSSYILIQIHVPLHNTHFCLNIQTLTMSAIRPAMINQESFRLSLHNTIQFFLSFNTRKLLNLI